MRIISRYLYLLYLLHFRGKTCFDQLITTWCIESKPPHSVWTQKQDWKTEEGLKLRLTWIWFSAEVSNRQADKSKVGIHKQTQAGRQTSTAAVVFWYTLSWLGGMTGRCTGRWGSSDWKISWGQNTNAFTLETNESNFTYFLIMLKGAVDKLHPQVVKLTSIPKKVGTQCKT